MQYMSSDEIIEMYNKACKKSIEDIIKEDIDCVFPMSDGQKWGIENTNLAFGKFYINTILEYYVLDKFGRDLHAKILVLGRRIISKEMYEHEISYGKANIIVWKAIFNRIVKNLKQVKPRLFHKITLDDYEKALRQCAMSVIDLTEKEKNYYYDYDDIYR